MRKDLPRSQCNEALSGDDKMSFSGITQSVHQKLLSVRDLSEL